jgi:hypothetical protein
MLYKSRLNQRHHVINETAITANITLGDHLTKDLFKITQHQVNCFLAFAWPPTDSKPKPPISNSFFEQDP